MEQIQVTTQCPHCGGAVIQVANGKTDEAIAVCKNCGVSFGRWADVEERARHFVIEDARRQFLRTVKSCRRKLK
ncbi:hypothetical protein [Cohaesibacter haloalkalitolerans]|uniref:hypothetical protein n=1 Tax=Cohaesibacter haloalkalitolerans TaxID=1162980 RepID=UPI000E64F442|nr:hypothetical protein [Cohaesibacter haloalkalitolerans]